VIQIKVVTFFLQFPKLQKLMDLDKKRKSYVQNTSSGLHKTKTESELKSLDPATSTTDFTDQTISEHNENLHD
jgi:hypothetical protein